MTRESNPSSKYALNLIPFFFFFIHHSTTVFFFIVHSSHYFTRLTLPNPSLSLSHSPNIHIPPSHYSILPLLTSIHSPHTCYPSPSLPPSLLPPPHTFAFILPITHPVCTFLTYLIKRHTYPFSLFSSYPSLSIRLLQLPATPFLSHQRAPPHPSISPLHLFPSSLAPAPVKQ